MVRQHQVENFARIDRVGDDVSILSHPDFHSELLDELLSDWILADLIIRHDGTIRAVGGRRLRGNVREQCPSGDAVDTVGSDQ